MEAEHIEEIEALSSIYGTEWKCENDEGTSYSMKIKPDVELFVTFKKGYPAECPPSYELLAPSLSAVIKQQITEEFREIYRENLGMPVLFQWIERLKEIVSEIQSDAEDVGIMVEVPTVEKKKEFTFTNVVHGPSINDRKSVFQGHAANICSEHQVKEFIEYLLENKKIAQATHNIYAYRIRLPSGVILQDCADDGENHAGSRLLHLLQIIDVMNCVVVVSRWYGGIHLGPDRFKHINNAARQVLLEAGFIKT